jgi:hypothetical protein
MIASFFDIFTEVSLDGGQTWSPSIGPARVAMRTPNPNPIPTLSQWGLIVLALLLLTLGTIYIRRQQPAMAFATGGATQSQRNAPLFTAAIFGKALVATLALAAAGCVGAVLWFGSIAPRDVAGTLVSAVIAAYWVHLLIAARKDDAPVRHE